MNVRAIADTAADLADEEAREVDHVGTEIAERARAGRPGVEPPHALERRVDDPLLQVAAAEVMDLAELAGLDQVSRASRTAGTKR